MTTRIESGHYTLSGYHILRDFASIGEFDEPGPIAWYVITDEMNDHGAGIPDALYEAATKRECVKWILNQTKDADK